MTKRANTAKKKNTPTLVKAAESVTMPVVAKAAKMAKAAKAIPVPAILLALGACAVGALAMFLLDATSGQRRRELIRDKALGAGHDVSELINKGGREVLQRVESVATQATQRLRGKPSEAMSNGRGDQRIGEQPMHT